MAQLSTFDDWVDIFHEWRKEIGADHPIVAKYKFEAKYSPLSTNEIEFGDYAGDRKWEKIMDIPDQRVRDALLNLIVFQGDTEFGSVEQQRNLFETAPHQYDLEALCRVMTEEMRHGWQMCDLLIKHFGRTGRAEALKQLERRSFDNKRLLTAFNDPVDNWLDFYTYTNFVDRDGKYQLTMLGYSSFAPLAQSMIPMLREESFHLGTGQDGLHRIIKAGRIPTTIMQKYINKWVPAAYDLFGVDNSSGAHWFYVWGLKGRFDEHEAGEVDKENLNEHNRALYQNEVGGLLDQLNKHVPEDQPKLYAPDLKFYRRIGDYVDQTYSVTGEKLTPEEHKKHLAEMHPSDADRALLKDIFKDSDWIVDKNATTHARD